MEKYTVIDFAKTGEEQKKKTAVKAATTNDMNLLHSILNLHKKTFYADKHRYTKLANLNTAKKTVFKSHLNKNIGDYLENRVDCFRNFP